MNKGRLILLWVLAAWLVFAILYPAYHPAIGEAPPKPGTSDFSRFEAARAAGLYREAYWSPEAKMSALLAVPALLFAIPLWLTLKPRS